MIDKRVPFVLATIASFMPKRVIECGIDLFRTLSLREMCRLQDSQLVSLFSDENFGLSDNENHTLVKVEDWKGKIREMLSDIRATWVIAATPPRINRQILQVCLDQETCALVYDVECLKPPRPHTQWSLEVVEGVGRITWELDL